MAMGQDGVADQQPPPWALGFHHPQHQHQHHERQGEDGVGALLDHGGKARFPLVLKRQGRQVGGWVGRWVGQESVLGGLLPRGLPGGWSGGAVPSCQA